jgi:hypothetical protein
MQAIEDAELEQHWRLLAQLTAAGSDDDENASSRADGHGKDRVASGEQQLWVQQ